MKVSISAITLAAALAIGLASPGSAHQETAGNLKIGHPWVREAAAGAENTYACIIVIANEGDEPETLLGATVDGAGIGVLYQIIEKDGKFSSKVVEHGLLIEPHGSIELPPDKYQFKFGKTTKALTADSIVAGTLVFEKLRSVPVHFMVEQDDTAPKEEAAPAEPVASAQPGPAKVKSRDYNLPWAKKLQ
ncbi:MAG: copper chaperone PCu(A)C [Beijerinckiaceae bacterium]